MRCGFIGHRDIVGMDEIIYTYVKKLMARGVTSFYSGGMGNFDKMCERAVKRAGGQVTLIAYNRSQKYDSSLYNEIMYPFGDKPYFKYDIPKRNEFLVDFCDVFLCCVYKKGGAKNTYDYAINKRKKIINLCKYIKAE